MSKKPDHGEKHRKEHPTENKRRGNPANLRPPWKKGQSGNPGGRPKGSVNLTNRLRAALSKNDGQLADIVVKKLIHEAAKGKFNHLHEIFDRIDGKVTQRIEIEATIEETKREFIQAAERVLDERSYSALLSELARVSAARAIAAEGVVH